MKNSQFQWRGYSRTPDQKFLVRLLVLGKQRYAGIATTEEAAARIYDAALWKLLPILPRRITPNFPDDFAAICDLDVPASVKNLFAVATNEMGYDCAQEAGQRAAKLIDMDKGLVVPLGIVDGYADALNTFRVNAIKDAAKFACSSARLPLVKFAEVEALRLKADEAYKRLDDALKALKVSFDYHAETLKRNAL